MRKLISLLMVAVIAVSCFTVTASAANINNCKWNKDYIYVTANGTAYGTNTFYIYGNLSKNKVQIKNSTPGAVLNVEDVQDAVYDVARFSVKIYKGSKLVNNYTVKLGGTFNVPAGLGTKYTVKIKYLPPASQSYMYKTTCRANSWYFTYKLLDI